MNFNGALGSLFLVNEQGYSGVYCGIRVMVSWMLILSMIELLSDSVPILDLSTSVIFPVPPKFKRSPNTTFSLYLVRCTYQSDLSQTPHTYHSNVT